jgi:hypothetical protein
VFAVGQKLNSLEYIEAVTDPYATGENSLFDIHFHVVVRLSGVVALPKTVSRIFF